MSSADAARMCALLAQFGLFAGQSSGAYLQGVYETAKRIRKGTLTLPNGTVEQQDDFKRAARQQELLVALGDQIARSDWVLRLPDILNAIAETVSTDFPRGDAGNLASLLPLVLQRNITKVVLGYPGYLDLPTQPLVNYLLIPRRAAVRAEDKKLFGADGPLKGWYVGSNAPLPPAAP